MVHKKDYCLFYFAPPHFLCVAVIGCTFYNRMKSFLLNHSYFYSYSLVFTGFYINKSGEFHKILVKLQVLKKINGLRNDFTPMCFGCLPWFSQKCNTRTRKLKLSTNQSKKCNTAQKYHRNSKILNFQHMSTISFINFWTK